MNQTLLLFIPFWSAPDDLVAALIAFFMDFTKRKRPNTITDEHQINHINFVHFNLNGGHRRNDFVSHENETKDEIV